jgi:hypothetical protein
MRIASPTLRTLPAFSLIQTTINNAPSPQDGGPSR